MLKCLSPWHNGTLLDFCSNGPWINPRLGLMVVHGKYYKLLIISNNQRLGTRDSGISGIKDKSVLSVYVLHVYVRIPPPSVLVCKWKSSNIHWIKTKQLKTLNGVCARGRWWRCEWNVYLLDLEKRHCVMIQALTDCVCVQCCENMLCWQIMYWIQNA